MSLNINSTWFMAIVDKSSRHKKKRFPVRPNFAFNSHLKKICSPSLLVCQWCFCCRIPSVVVVVVLCSVMEPHPRRAVSSRLGRKAIHAETRRQYKKSSHGNLHHLTTHPHPLIPLSLGLPLPSYSASSGLSQELEAQHATDRPALK